MYTDSPVERRTITNTITGSSSIKPNDSYNVTTIKSGDITSDTFKEGDVVKKGDKLYQFEDSDAQNSLSTAKNALAKAQQAYVDAVKAKGTDCFFKQYRYKVCTKCSDKGIKFA